MHWHRLYCRHLRPLATRATQLNRHGASADGHWRFFGLDAGGVWQCRVAGKAQQKHTEVEAGDSGWHRASLLLAMFC